MSNFKIGDFVLSTYDDYLQPYKVFRSDNGTTSMRNLPDEYITRPDNQVILWEPKEGEWCWFYNDGDSTGHFAMFSYESIDYGYVAKDETEWKNIEPFTGNLPDFLKDIK